MPSSFYTLFIVVSIFVCNAVAFTTQLPHGYVNSQGVLAREAVVVQKAKSNVEEDTTQDTRKQEEKTNGIVEDQKGNNELLNEAIQVYNSPSANALITRITEMRNSKDPKSQEMLSNYLDDLLMNGPDSSLPLWARFRPLVRFSKRARLFSLRRLLDLTTPPPSEEQQQQQKDDAEMEQQRRRRALLAVLRSLAQSTEEEENCRKLPAVVELEKKSRQSIGTGSSLLDSDDLRSRLPEGLETPDYTVVATKKNSKCSYEIRKYDSFSVCSVSTTKPRPKEIEKTDAKVSMPQMSGASSFGALAGYLFGKNQDSKAMQMTTPVLMNGEGDNKKMSFVLPSEYWMKNNGVDTAPKPFAESGVELEQISGGERAVVMFGGYASRKAVNIRKKQLLDALAMDKDYVAVVDEPIATAQYNDPFTPPWKRLNEVSISVMSR